VEQDCKSGVSVWIPLESRHRQHGKSLHFISCVGALIVFFFHSSVVLCSEGGF